MCFGNLSAVNEISEAISITLALIPGEKEKRYLSQHLTRENTVCCWPLQVKKNVCLVKIPYWHSDYILVSNCNGWNRVHLPCCCSLLAWSAYSKHSFFSSGLLAQCASYAKSCTAFVPWRAHSWECATWARFQVEVEAKKNNDEGMIRLICKLTSLKDSYQIKLPDKKSEIT